VLPSGFKTSYVIIKECRSLIRLAKVSVGL